MNKSFLNSSRNLQYTGSEYDDDSSTVDLDAEKFICPACGEHIGYFEEEEEDEEWVPNRLNRS